MIRFHVKFLLVALFLLLGFHVVVEPIPIIVKRHRDLFFDHNRLPQTIPDRQGNLVSSVGGEGVVDCLGRHRFQGTAIPKIPGDM